MLTFLLVYNLAFEDDVMGYVFYVISKHTYYYSPTGKQFRSLAKVKKELGLK